MASGASSASALQVTLWQPLMLSPGASWLLLEPLAAGAVSSRCTLQRQGYNSCRAPVTHLEHDLAHVGAADVDVRLPRPVPQRIALVFRLEVGSIRPPVLKGPTAADTGPKAVRGSDCYVSGWVAGWGGCVPWLSRQHHNCRRCWLLVKQCVAPGVVPDVTNRKGPLLHQLAHHALLIVKAIDAVDSDSRDVMAVQKPAGACCRPTSICCQLHHFNTT